MSISLDVAKTVQSCSKTNDLQFVIGQDLRGNWVVAEVRQRGGGIFLSREAALKYAASEWGQQLEMIRWSNTPMVLWN